MPPALFHAFTIARYFTLYHVTAELKAHGQYRKAGWMAAEAVGFWLSWGLGCWLKQSCISLQPATARERLSADCIISQMSASGFFRLHISLMYEDDERVSQAIVAFYHILLILH